MLGEKLYEVKGKVQGQRVLPADAAGPKMEISFAGPLQGYGRLADFKGMFNGTYYAVARPDGVFCGEGQGIAMAANGDSFSGPGNGVGKLAGGKFIYRGGFTFRAASPKLEWLCGVYGVFEFEQDINTQEVTFTCYAWE